MAQCLTPFHVKAKKGNPAFFVPCGRCPNCYVTRQSQWSFRLMHQYNLPHTLSAYFVTLTYAPKHLPFTPNGRMTLNYDHLTTYFKALRYLDTGHEAGGIKYFAVGEYGTRFQRPHYHIILFNARYDDIIDAWPHGHVHLDVVNNGTVGYCFKYIGKSSKVGMFEGDDRLKERSRMSKGIGAEYLSTAVIKWHRADLYNRMYLRSSDGKKCSMPRYYKDRIYRNIERQIIGLRAEAARDLEVQKRINEVGLETYNHEKLEYEKYRFRRFHATCDAPDRF